MYIVVVHTTIHASHFLYQNADDKQNNNELILNITNVETNVKKANMQINTENFVMGYRKASTGEMKSKKKVK